jgi:hypothetical protein
MKRIAQVEFCKYGKKYNYWTNNDSLKKGDEVRFKDDRAVVKVCNILDPIVSHHAAKKTKLTLEDQ